MKDKMKQPEKPTPETIVSWCRRGDGMVDQETLNKMCEIYDVQVFGYMVYDPKYDVKLKLKTILWGVEDVDSTAE